MRFLIVTMNVSIIVLMGVLAYLVLYLLPHFTMFMGG